MKSVLLFLVSFGLLITGCTSTDGPPKNETNNSQYEIPPLVEAAYINAKNEGIYESYRTWYDTELNVSGEKSAMENATRIELSRCLDRYNSTVYRLTKEGEGGIGSEVDYYDEGGVFIGKESVYCGGMDCVVYQRGDLPPPQIRPESSCIKIREDRIVR